MSSELSFWEDVGRHFPSLKGAPSTSYYAACERWLMRHLFPPLAGRSLLKTDLWDEAKNSEILLWAADQGARVYGVDLAYDVLLEARKVLAQHRPGVLGGDVRRMPFGDASFDLVYSMGTIEHAPQYAQSIAEIFRVLRPGGTAIVGVPNKLDPFLRPLMVHLMNGLRIYGYGMEKSFTHGQLTQLLRAAGFEVVASSGILFMPGWLRMLDLWCHTHPRTRALTRLTRLAVRPFAWAYEHLPWVRGHGYLIAVVGRRPLVA